MADRSGYHTEVGKRFFPMRIENDGRVLLRLEINERTLATARLMITQEFWDAYKNQLGEAVYFLWTDSPETYGNERLTLHEKPDGTGYFNLEWLKFYKRHQLEFGDILYLTYVGNSTFHVTKPCYGWLGPEREEILVDPEYVIDLLSDDEPEEDNEEVVVIEDEPEQPNPVVARRPGRRRPSIDIPQGYHFGCAYPYFM